MALDGEGGGGIPATMLVGPTGVGNNAMPYPYPVFGGMGGGSGMGGFGNDGGWIVLLLIIILVAAGGWGNNGSGGGFGGQPIVINDGGNYGSVQRGFDQAAVMSGINALTTNVCNGFADVQQALCNGFAGVEQGANTRQMANMQQLYGLQSQFADCCCENRLATESLRATVLSENCADRYEAANNTRDIITAITAGIQSVKDELCADRLESYKRENDNLRSQLTMANLAASQIAQTAQIQRGQVEEVDALYQRLRDCPVPCQPVYGSQPIFTCNNGGGGCGNFGGFNGNF